MYLTIPSQLHYMAREILRAEGGLVDHPNDPGGLTNYGISQRAYPGVDIRALTSAEAIEILYRDYFKPVGGQVAEAAGELKLAHLLWDTAINVGVYSASCWLQLALGGVSIDGKVGPLTRKKLDRTLEDPVQSEVLFTSIVRSRLRHYVVLDSFETFGRGWVRRVVDIMEG